MENIVEKASEMKLFCVHKYLNKIFINNPVVLTKR
jgi:hypothetical protein